MADKPTTVEEQIERTAIDGIQSATTQGQSVTKQSISELIEADKYLQGKTAQKRNHLGVFMRKIVPGGCG
jgi:hypothetical protein